MTKRAMRVCARCKELFIPRRKNDVLCASCWKSEGSVGPIVSETGRGGSLAQAKHGMLEDNYGEESQP